MTQPKNDANFVVKKFDSKYHKNNFLLISVDSSARLDLVMLHGNPWHCDQCHITHLKNWLQSSLMYWGSCFSENSPPCLRCMSPLYLNQTPVVDLVIVPECGHINPDFSSMTATITTVSQYVAICILLLVMSILVMIIVSKYRHYGVYNTGEEDDKEECILTDPIHVLDRQLDSYVNLRYPTMTKD